MIVQDRAWAAHSELAARVLDDLLQVKVPDREMVLVESRDGCRSCTSGWRGADYLRRRASGTPSAAFAAT